MTCFNNSMTQHLDKYAPLCTIKVDQEDRPPWIDPEYVLACAKRRSLERKYKHSRARSDKSLYSAQCKLCRKMVRDKRCQFYGKTLFDIGGDQKSLFRFVHKISGDSDHTSMLPNNYTDTVSLANDFNTFFINKIKDIRSKFVDPMSSTSNEFEIGMLTNVNRSVTETGPTLEVNASEAPYDQNSFLTDFVPCTESEISDLLKISGITVSPLDIFPKPLLKNELDFFLPYLTFLVNLSLSSGSIDGLKEAAVRPLLKEHGLDPNLMSHFRPISNLSFIGKLIERVVLARLQKHLDNNNLNNHRQFGYKKKHGTETLIIKFINDIVVGIDSKKGVVVMLIDLSAAFDTVDHRKLLNILCYEYNIRGIALKWFKSFLVGRSQCVLIDSVLSEPLELSFGVPQGSVLGPVLFNIYVSSVSSVFSAAGFNCLGYADDNMGYQVFSVTSQSQVLNFDVPQCIQDLKDWMSSYFLQLNEDKTKIIVFGSNSFLNLITINETYALTGDLIEFSDTVKYLGVYLDQQLTFRTHINKITSHCYMLLKNISGIRKFLTQEQTEILVHAVISSRLDYCNSILFGQPQYLINKFQRVQDCGSKIILRRGRRHGMPSSLRREILHWLPINSRILFRVLLLVFYCHIGKAPIELSCLLVPLVSDINQSRNGLLYDTRFYFPKTSFGRRAFSFHAPRLWNCLPQDLRCSTEVDVFKKNLKTYLWNHSHVLIEQYKRFF